MRSRDTWEVVTAPLPAKVYAHEGIAQVVFFSTEKCEKTYRDRVGVYQRQLEITFPAVRQKHPCACATR